MPNAGAGANSAGFDLRRSHDFGICYLTLLSVKSFQKSLFSTVLAYFFSAQTSLMEATLADPAKMGEDDGDGDRLAAIAAIERVERESHHD